MFLILWIRIFCTINIKACFLHNTLRIMYYVKKDIAYSRGLLESKLYDICPLHSSMRE